MRRVQEAVAFKMHETSDTGAKYVTETGMRKVATGRLELPPGWSVGLESTDAYELKVGCAQLTVSCCTAQACQTAVAHDAPRTTLRWVCPFLQAEMRFGGTEVLLIARDVKSGNSVARKTEWLSE
jgi:hypothetical protein